MSEMNDSSRLLLFRELPLLFLIVTAPVDIPTNSVGGFPFLTSPPTLVICRLLMLAIQAGVQ